MGFTVDTDSARVTSLGIQFAEDGRVYLYPISGDVRRKDGTVDRPGFVARPIELTDAALKAALANIQPVALAALKAEMRWDQEDPKGGKS